MAGLAILKHMHDLSDESLCDRWLENSYYQYFCGEEFFRHKLPFDRSSITRWRQRMGDERLVALLQESLAVATRTGAAKPADFTRVMVDTIVQPKAIAFPKDAKLLARARAHLMCQAKRHGVALLQSYERVGKAALIRHQRYAHAKQFKRANRALKILGTQLGRVLRDIRRKIKDDADLRAAFAPKLALAERIHAQTPKQRGPKTYTLHAPEVECIGKGKSHKPYEFGVKVSVATPIQRCKGGSSSLMSRLCQATHMTATHWPGWCPRSPGRSAIICNELSPIKDIAAITRPRPGFECLHLRLEARRH